MASYAQMSLDLRPLVFVLGLVAGVVAGGFDVCFWRYASVRRIRTAAVLLLLGAVALLAMFLIPALRLIALVPALAGMALVVWSVDQAFWRLGVRRPLRCGLIGLAGLLTLALLDLDTPRHLTPGWVLGPLLLVWSLASWLAGETPAPASTASRD